jgi:7-cyano-7-deazaguanine reductase
MKKTARSHASKRPRAHAADDAVGAGNRLPVTVLEVGERVSPAAPPSAPSRRLDVFANPTPERDYVIQFVIPEFTCLCPLTGQPDYARFTIDMVCDRLCVELKSLKNYCWSYRDTGAFHERVTNEILDDLVRATAPRYARIVAKWNVRGGIWTSVIAEHRAKGWTPASRVELPAGG